MRWSKSDVLSVIRRFNRNYRSGTLLISGNIDKGGVEWGDETQASIKSDRYTTTWRHGKVTDNLYYYLYSPIKLSLPLLLLESLSCLFISDLAKISLLKV